MPIASVPVWRLALICFLSMGIPFGAFMGLGIGGIFRSAAAGAVAGVSLGAVFGGLMTLVFVGLHVALARGAGGSVAGVAQTDEFVLASDLAGATAAAMQALRGLRVSATITEQSGIVLLEGRTPVSWKCWGEKVCVELDRRTNDEVRVIVRSRPVIWTTLVDYGKNRENVEFLRAEMSGGGRQLPCVRGGAGGTGSRGQG